ncbi:MAG TPA: YfiR family protein [Thermoanaerobaculia bacterium]|nr:YfiR family protein [Thermoanaerobaculia bacterium]
MAILIRVLAALVLLLLISPAVEAQDASSLEYGVKAAFLYNFTKFVEWPKPAFDERGSLRLCVLGQDPFGKSLSSVVEGEEVQGRPITLLRIDSLDDPRLCHLLFLGRTETSRFPAVLAAVRGAPVLTVGEAPGLLEKGVGINFVLVDGKVRFEINQAAVEAHGLKMSSKLLRLATRVERGTP